MQFRSLKSVQTVFKVLRVFVVIGMVIIALSAVACFVGGIAVMSDGGMLSRIVSVTFAEQFGVSIEIDTTLAGWALFLLIIPAAAMMVVMMFEWRYLTDELNRDRTPFSRRGVEQLRSVAFVAIVVPIAAAVLLKIIYAFIGIQGASFLGDTIVSSVTRGAILYILAYIFEHGAELAEKVNELSGNGLPPRE